VSVGAGLGFLAGLTGTGGGIFLNAASAVLPLGAHSSGRRCFGTVHLGELNCRADWLLYEKFVPSLH